MHWMIETQVGYPVVSEVAPSPDGATVLFVAREPYLGEEQSRFVTQIYALATAGDGTPVQLTFGDRSALNPCWSPDGQYIAFVAERGEHAELRCMRRAGGESWQLAALGHAAIASPRFSRDGKTLAFLAPLVRSDAEQRAIKAGDDAYAWGSELRSSQLYTIPFAVGPRVLAEPVARTSGPFHVLAHDWLADGTGLAFTAMASPNADGWAESWLGIARFDPPEIERLGTLAFWDPTIAVAPDGTQIACLTFDGPHHWAGAARVTLFPLAGGPARSLAATPDTQPSLVGWLPDGQSLIIHEVAGVRQQLYRLPVDGGAPVALQGPAVFEVVGMAANGQVALAGEDLEQPVAIYAINQNGEYSRLGAPALPADWPAAQLPRAEVLHWQARDGQPIEGILTYPLGDQPGPYPLVLIIHGGPTGYYQRSFLGSPVGYGHLCGLAERGIATLRVNPRGSSGYGKPFRYANMHDWGGGDYQDLIAGIEHVIASGIADPQRLGVMGWSYGGFLASWIITQTNRFRAACIGAPVTDPISFNGTADIPSFIPSYFGAEFWQNSEPYQRMSPLAHVANVQTPALIQHGDADIRVPLSQGRQFYEALRRRGIPTELVVYPRQGHLFHEPRMIIAVRKRCLAWFEQYLLG